MNTWPNWFTFLRLIAAVALPAVFLLAPGGAGDKIAMAVFVFGALTDIIDGFLARKLNRPTRFGEFLDPVADKMLVITALLLLAADGRAPIVAVLIIVCREVAVSALREWAALSAGERLSVSASGKIKTWAQMTAVAVLFYNDSFFALSKDAVVNLGSGILWAAALLSLHSFTLYAHRAWKYFRK